MPAWISTFGFPDPMRRASSVARAASSAITSPIASMRCDSSSSSSPISQCSGSPSSGLNARPSCEKNPSIVEIETRCSAWTNSSSTAW